MSISNKSITAGMMLLTMILMAQSYACASDNAFEKFGRGITNVVTAPISYYASYETLSDDTNPITSLFGAMLQGTLETGKRILGGVYEIVTFPIPIPENYEPLMDPATPISN